MIRRTSVLILLGLVAAMSITSWWTVRVLKRPKSLTELKLAEAQRVLYYRMTPASGPSIRLSGAEETLRFITHVILPDGTLYDPTRRFRYGIKLTITAEGREIWEHEIHTHTRQSKDELHDGTWRYENSFLRDPRVQVTDDRVFLVHLPRTIPPNAVLTATLLGDEAAEGLLRVYNQTRRGFLEQQVAASSLPLDRQQAEVRSNTYEPWSMVPADEKLSRVRYRTERLSAIGERGTDYDTRTVYYTGFRLPSELAELEEALKVHEHRPAALNVLGPTELEIRAEHMTGEDMGEDVDDDALLEVDSVAASGRESLRPSVLHVGETTTLSIPAGLHTVRISTRSPHTLAVWLTGPRSALFGAPGDVGDDPGLLRPDEIRIPVFLIGPALEPVHTVGMGAPDPLSRLLRIEVRLIDTTGPMAPARRREVEHEEHVAPGQDHRFAATLSVRLLDHQGELLRAVEEPIVAARAPFEWLDRSGMQPIEVSEPVSARFIAPEGISHIEISASEPALLRLFRYLPGEQEYELPYREVELGEDVRWRYARVEKRIWWPLRAINQDVLHDGEQLATLVAQARLVQRSAAERTRPDLDEDADEDADENADEDGGQDDDGQGDGQGVGQGDGQRGGRAAAMSAVAIEPLDDPERHTIREPIPPGRVDRARAAWGAGMLAALPPGRAATYLFDPAAEVAHRPARVHFQVRDEDLGQDVAIAVDGEIVATERLWTAQGYWELPPLAPGAHQVEIVSQARSLELLVDRPPASPDLALLRMRTVFVMDRKPMRLRVVRPMRGTATLHAVIYAPGLEERPDLPVRAVVSGGRPMRVEGEILPSVTRAARQVDLPAARHDQPAVLATRQSGSIGYPRVIKIPLGEDLTPGTHIVELYSVTGRPLWVRFYVTNQDPTPPGERVLQWNFVDMP